MIVSNYLSLSCPCFMGGTPMPRGVLQEPQTKNLECGGKRYSARRRFEQCVSAHSAERKRCRDRAQRGSCHRRFRRCRRRDRRRSSRRLPLPVLRDGTKDHPSAQRKAARGDTRPPTFASSREITERCSPKTSVFSVLSVVPKTRAVLLLSSLRATAWSQ